MVALSVKNELVAQGVRADHIKVKGSGADGEYRAVQDCAGTGGFADCLARSVVLCTGRGGHVFITVSKIDLEAAGIARGLATPNRSFAEHLDEITMSPEQQAKVRVLVLACVDGMASSCTYTGLNEPVLLNANRLLSIEWRFAELVAFLCRGNYSIKR